MAIVLTLWAVRATQSLLCFSKFWQWIFRRSFTGFDLTTLLTCSKLLTPQSYLGHTISAEFIKVFTFGFMSKIISEGLISGLSTHLILPPKPLSYADYSVIPLFVSPLKEFPKVWTHNSEMYDCKDFPVFVKALTISFRTYTKGLNSQPFALLASCQILWAIRTTPS